MAKGNKADKPKKGVPASRNTGPETRAAFAKARKAGATTEDIAKAINRDESTVLKIEAGLIKRPPGDLDTKVKRAKKSSSKPTKKSMGTSRRKKGHK